VTLAGEVRDGRLVISVTDTGPGMPAGDVDRLFAAFEQGEAGRRHGGTGLGLALCRQLAEALGGTLGAQSGPGGSTFTVDLPVLPVDGSVDGAVDGAVGLDLPGEGGAPSTPPGLRVLLVDDSELSLMVGTALLEQLGASVTTAQDGEAAVEAARTASFDAVLMDRHMPRLDASRRPARCTRCPAAGSSRSSA
jgi:hypothetical protein